MQIELFLFMFSIIFPININGFKLRTIIEVLWIIETLAFCKIKGKKVKVSTTNFSFILILVLCLGYNLILSAVNETYYIGLIGAFLRCIVSLITIIIFFSVRKYDLKIFLRVLRNLLLVHAAVIIIGFIFKDFGKTIYFINEYSKKTYQFRSIGLVNGYDIAGILTNFGLILNMYYNSYLKKKVLDLRCVIFIISTLLTSRLNIVIVSVVLFITFIIEIKKRKVRNALMLSKYVLGTVLIVLGVFLLTTGLSVDARSNLFRIIPVTKNISKNLINKSYVDYKGKNVFMNQLKVDDDINIIFGSSVKAKNKDPGYINTIYASGLIGVFMELAFYLLIYVCVENIRKRNRENPNIIVSVNSIKIYILILMIMEFKIKMLFSSIIFEFMLLFFIYLNKYVKGTSNDMAGVKNDQIH